MNTHWLVAHDHLDPIGPDHFMDCDGNLVVIHWVNDAQILNIFGDELLVDAKGDGNVYK